MPRYTDLMELKNDTARIETIRARVSQFLLQVSKGEFGADYVRFADHKISITPGGQDVAKYTVIADVGDGEDEGGFPVGICVEISVKVKKWKTVKDKNNKTRYGVTLDDYIAVLDKGDKGE